MINQEEEFLGVDKNSGFALRVLILSVPAGLIFLILGLFDILSTPLAALSYICILFFNTVFLMPISIELQQIKKYILSLSSGANEEKLLSNLTEKETRDLTEAINSMHKFWVDKTGMLENRTLSDAAVLDTLPDPLLMINKQGAVIGANLAARTLFETGLNGREIREFIPDANFNATLSKVLAGQSRHEEMNLCLADRRDKPKFYLRISTIPWFAKGEVIAVISFYDLHKALQLEQMQQDFVTNASHELRTPLNAIIGFSELLMDDPAPTEKQEYMRIIRSNGEVLMQQLSDILDLSKIEAGTLGYEYSDVELNAVMEELEGGFRMRQPENSPVRITFHRKYPVRYIRTDRKRLIQVIANLLSNAVKFTSEGSVDFGFEIRGGELYVYVADTGAGIPEEHRGQLFQRFVKAGSFRQGIGIGLAISKSIVETMGGRIGVESRPGKGSTFWFTLPCKPEQ